MKYQQVFPIFTHSAKHVCFVPTYQDSCDDVSSVLQAVSVVAAPNEARSSHVLFIFIPVADLRQKEQKKSQSRACISWQMVQRKSV